MTSDKVTRFFKIGLAKHFQAMNSHLRILSLVLFACCAFSASIVIPGQYLITFTPDIVKAPETEMSHYTWLAMQGIRYNRVKKESIAILHKYSIGDQYKLSQQGYAAKLSPSLAKNIAQLPYVAHVEPDQTVSISTVQKTPPSWGLSRISGRNLTTNSSSYIYPDSAGEGVYVYVIDTGVCLEHSEFEGRAIFGASFSGDGDKDGNGHGTHCAGTIASSKYGVAKKANVVAVKVLNAFGSGSYSGVVAGIAWAVSNATGENRIGKAVKCSFDFYEVASMSLGGSKSLALNSAVAAGIKAGVPFSVAAGNDYEDACDYSPASELTAFTVAASTLSDKLAPFSNWGSCVDIIAPGVDITSTWIAPLFNKTISGTSMAAPHVAGVLALVLSEISFSTVQDLFDYVKEISTPDAFSKLPINTTNTLLYNAALIFPSSQDIYVDDSGEDIGIISASLRSESILKII